MLKSFPVQEDTTHLEPQQLDFRYRPNDWQTCIGLPDDPHKSIVFSDGTIYYDYSHPREGKGLFRSFQTRITAALDVEKETVQTTQNVWSGKVPVVTTEARGRGITAASLGRRSQRTVIRFVVAETR